MEGVTLDLKEFRERAGLTPRPSLRERMDHDDSMESGRWIGKEIARRRSPAMVDATSTDVWDPSEWTEPAGASRCVIAHLRDPLI